MGQGSGWMVNGFHAWVALWVWLGIVLVYGLAWRSLLQPDPDPVRPPGPGS